MSGSTNVLSKATSLDVSPAFSPFTGVRLWYDDENVIFSGDETGRVLEADCPWATQEIADSVLAAIRGYVYQPFTAQTAILDPVAELGDGVNVGGVYGPLAVINATFGSMFSAEIGAPQDEELDHEYPYLSGAERKFKRQIATTRSLITKTADEIGLEIAGINGAVSSLQLSLEGLESTVSGKVGEDEVNSLIKQSIDSIELSVSSNDGSTTLKLTGGGVELSSETVELSVDALNIHGKINADQLNLTGSITFGDLDSDTQDQINDRGISASRARTIINDELVSSPNIMGANYWSSDENTWMNLLDASETSVGIGGGLEVQTSNITIFSAIKDAFLNAILSAYNTDFLMVTSKGKIYPQGEWDFQFADVSGLGSSGGGDPNATVVPVWG